MKKLLMIAAVLMLVFGMCIAEEDAVTSATLKIDRLPPVAESENRHILVAYFSPDDTVRAAAYTIAAELDAALFEIVPEELYTADDLNYMNSKSRSMTEMMDQSARPAIAALPEDLSAYIWCRTAIRPRWRAPRRRRSWISSTAADGRSSCAPPC